MRENPKFLRHKKNYGPRKSLSFDILAIFFELFDFSRELPGLFYVLGSIHRFVGYSKKHTLMIFGNFNSLIYGPLIGLPNLIS